MKRTYSALAGGLVAALALAVTVVASPSTKLPSNQRSSAGVYIQYDRITDNIDRAHGYPVVGGHKRWEWKSLEPTRGNRLFDSQVRTFIMEQAGRGKKAALGIETFVGRINRSPPNGALSVPDWLWQDYPSSRLQNTLDSQGWYVLNYLDAGYQTKYAEFVNALAQWLADNPTVAANVGWVEMGVGMYGETQPSDQWVTANKKDYEYYDKVLGLTGPQWKGYVNWCTDTYYHAFRNRGLSIPIFLNCAPDYKSQRTAFTDYAANKGVGLKNNGLQEDRFPANLYDPLIKWWPSKPIAWETYEQWLASETELYWGLLCALDKHPDVLEPDRWLMIDHSQQKRTNYVAIWNWVAPFLGVDASTTPSAWCALRQTQTGGEQGNFEFYLSHEESYGPNGSSVKAFNVVPGTKEGRYTRRTDQDTGQVNMWFRLDDAFVNGNPSQQSFTVKVVYLDQGTDTWRLTYDSLDAQSREKVAGAVTKNNSNTWKTATFVLGDARFGNGIGTQSDLRIDCNHDGNEHVHMVEVQRGGVAPPTATPTLAPTAAPTQTPTVTPVLCRIEGSVTLQGRPTPPGSHWSVPLTVTVGSTVYVARTDSVGRFVLSGLNPGQYDITVTAAHTLGNVRRGFELAAGSNTVDMGVLLEGDVDASGRIDSVDFGLLRSSYFKGQGQTGFVVGADFNEDGVVNSLDFALLRSNYFRTGPVELSAAGGGGS